MGMGMGMGGDGDGDGGRDGSHGEVWIGMIDSEQKSGI